MRRMVLSAAAILLGGWTIAVFGQTESHDPAATLIPAGPASPIQQEPPPPNHADVLVRLATIEAAIQEVAKQTPAPPDYTPALMSLGGTLFGVLVGGVISIWSQRREIAHQQALAERRARLEIANSFVQWQLKQLSELYGPLHALLRQSHALYRHMNKILIHSDNSKFQLRDEPGSHDFDKQVFEIMVDGQWTTFRTIMHIGDVYGRNYGIEKYFDEVIAIGARIVQIIREKAGYTRPEQADLIALFGKYLAHYSVLQGVHAKMVGSKSESVLPMEVEESAVFPREIQGMVDIGYNAIILELNEWRTKAST